MSCFPAFSPQFAEATSFPFVGYIRTFFPRARTVGSGALISPQVVLTAGHIVYDAVRGGGANRFEVSFGGNNGLAIESRAYRTNRYWTDNDSRLGALSAWSAYDVGAVILPQPIDTQIRYLSVKTTPGVKLRQMPLSVAGFPARARGALYGARTTPCEMSPYRIRYPVRTTPGMSGGPVYDYDSQTQIRTVRAIHTSIIQGAGSALRITENVYRLIRRWLEEFRPADSS